VDSGGGKHSPISSTKLKSKKTTQNETNLSIATYNIRSMNKDDKVYELEEELKQIKWDVLGISEVRRRGEQCIQLKSGNTFYYRGALQDEEDNIGGVGFMLNKTIATKVTEFKSFSKRVALIKLKITKFCTLKIIQVYAPTISYEDEEVEMFYEEITAAMQHDLNPSQYTIIMGDFNAKLGGREEPEEEKIGSFGLGKRNERGQTLMNFLEQQKLYAMNTFYKKKVNRKWTWISPNKEHKNEIDYILSNNKRIFKDVSVINYVGAGSDHRMVRAKITIDKKWERTKIARNIPTLIDTTLLKEKSMEYRIKLKEKLNQTHDYNKMTIDEMNTTMNKAMLESAKNVAKVRKQKSKQWSNKTEDLFKKRRTLLQRGDHGSIEYTETNKTLRKSIREDKRKHIEEMIERAIEKGKNMKSVRTSLGNSSINAVKDETGNVITEREKILRTTEKFYINLYEQKQPAPEEVKVSMKNIVMNVGSEDIPDITDEEIKSNIKAMKRDKAPGIDGIVPDLIKEGEETLLEPLRTLLNLCLHERKIPEDWNKLLTILLHKKGDKNNLKNYRPISLLPQVYKLLTRIITSRLENKLEHFMNCEQAGFRKNFSTSDHILTLKTLIEKVTEYNLPLYLAFIDYEKAFDSVEWWAVQRTLQKCRVDYRYAELIQTIYENTTTIIQLHDKTEPIPIRCGVRQGDPMSPKLFIAVMQDLFSNLDWDDKGVKINGKRLNNLKYADDVVLIANSFEELQTMLEEVNNESKKIGLKLNRDKTKIMTNQNETRDIIVEQTVISRTEEYVYLGTVLTCGKANRTAEVSRRIRSAWSAFGRQSKILRDQKIPLNLRSSVFNQCVLPVLSYAAQTWCFTKGLMDKLAKTQRAMERLMLNIKLKDRVRNEDIRKKTKLIDVKQHIASLKWRWAGHTLRQSDNRWNKEIQLWRPWLGKRNRGRPQTRWRDDLKLTAGFGWARLAQNRELWRQKGEAYIQHWMTTG